MLYVLQEMVQVPVFVKKDTLVIHMLAVDLNVFKIMIVHKIKLVFEITALILVLDSVDTMQNASSITTLLHVNVYQDLKVIPSVVVLK